MLEHVTAPMNLSLGQRFHEILDVEFGQNIETGVQTTCISVKLIDVLRIHRNLDLDTRRLVRRTFPLFDDDADIRFIQGCSVNRFYAFMPRDDRELICIGESRLTAKAKRTKLCIRPPLRAPRVLRIRIEDVVLGKAKTIIPHAEGRIEGSRQVDTNGPLWNARFNVGIYSIRAVLAQYSQHLVGVQLIAKKRSQKSLIYGIRRKTKRRLTKGTRTL